MRSQYMLVCSMSETVVIFLLRIIAFFMCDTLS